jgi:hypothetical protein
MFAKVRKSGEIAYVGSQQLPFVLLSPRDGLILEMKQQFKQGNCYFFHLAISGGR